MSVTIEQVLLTIGGASSIATAIFWSAYLIGKYANRIESLEKRVDGHDQQLAELRGGL